MGDCELDLKGGAEIMVTELSLTEKGGATECTCVRMCLRACVCACVCLHMRVCTCVCVCAWGVCMLSVSSQQCVGRR